MEWGSSQPGAKRFPESSEKSAVIRTGVLCRSAPSAKSIFTGTQNSAVPGRNSVIWFNMAFSPLIEKFHLPGKCNLFLQKYKYSSLKCEFYTSF
jgi:hypothetical protein